MQIIHCGGGSAGPSAVTIGKFDGVHTGHRAVIDELRSTGSPETASAVSTALGPGTAVTRTSCATAATTRR